MNSAPQKRILLLDDHTLFAEGLSSKFIEKGFEVDVATQFETCQDLLGKNQYDLWLCDINLEGKNGLDLVQTMRETNAPDLMIWMLSAYNEPYLIEKAKRLRVNGYCTKSTPFEQLLEAIQNPSGGFVLLSNDAPSEINHTSGETPKAFVLTRQERKIIQLVVDGLSSKDIAERLFISKYTVDTHRRNILKKLDVKSITALIKTAHANRLVD
jgi:two-component system nitrate/nitrite response regulator NarL